MKNLEQLISRYLDQELTLQEEAALRRLLDSSPEAQETLQQMETLRAIARRLPRLTQPSLAVENQLFQKLFAEESEEKNRRPVPSPLLSRITDAARRRAGVLVPALTLLVAVGTSLWAFLAIDNGDVPQIAAVAAITESTDTDSPITNIPQTIVSSGQTESQPTTTIPSTASPAIKASMAPGNTLANNTHQEGLDENNSGKASASNAQLPVNRALSAQQTSASANRQSTEAQLAEAQWPPMQLLEDSPVAITENNIAASANQDRNPTNAVSESDVDATKYYAYHQKPKNAIVASYRHGLSYIQGDNEEFSAQDFSIRVEGRFHERHRISLALGQSPLLIERTSTTLPTGIAVDPDKQGPTIASERVDYSSRLTDEVWAGIGYGFAVVSSKKFRVEPGLSFGVGEESIRFGAELPIRYRLNNRFSVDVVASLSRVEPHDISQQDVDREYDQPFFLHVDEEEHAAFTSIGAHIGLSIDLGR